MLIDGVRLSVFGDNCIDVGSVDGIVDGIKCCDDVLTVVLFVDRLGAVDLVFGVSVSLVTHL